MKTEFSAKAKENLTAARICFENGLYNACANRTYDAALHAAVAALAHRGIKRDKINHGQVQADFSGELIKRRKVYPSRFRSCLPDLQFVRNQADYSSEDVSRKRAYKRLSLSEELTGFVEKEILK